MTEIPEHLLKRSRERRSAMGDGGDDAPSSAPAKAAATTPAAATPPAAAPQPAIVVQAKPDPAYIQAAKQRTKIPFWAMAPLALLPVWAWMYVRSVQDHPTKVEGPRAVGAAVYGKCSGCHGADGGGGSGRQLSAGEVLKTFPAIEDQMRWIAFGTDKYKAAGVTVYGNPNRDGGVHQTGSFGVMPGWQGELNDAQILAVVCYLRYDISGADSASATYAAEYTKWCDTTAPGYETLAGGKTFADPEFADVGNAPKAGSDKPYPAAGA